MRSEGLRDFIPIGAISGFIAIRSDWLCLSKITSLWEGWLLRAEGLSAGWAISREAGVGVIRWGGVAGQEAYETYLARFKEDGLMLLTSSGCDCIGAPNNVTVATGKGTGA